MNYKCYNAAKLRAEGKGGSSEGHMSRVPPSAWVEGAAGQAAALLGLLSAAESGLVFVRVGCEGFLLLFFFFPPSFFLKTTGYSNIDTHGLLWEWVKRREHEYK